MTDGPNIKPVEPGGAVTTDETKPSPAAKTADGKPLAMPDDASNPAPESINTPGVKSELKSLGGPGNPVDQVKATIDRIKAENAAKSVPANENKELKDKAKEEQKEALRIPARKPVLPAMAEDAPLPAKKLSVVQVDQLRMYLRHGMDSQQQVKVLQDLIPLIESWL